MANVNRGYTRFISERDGQAERQAKLKRKLIRALEIDLYGEEAALEMQRKRVFAALNLKRKIAACYEKSFNNKVKPTLMIGEYAWHKAREKK